MATAFSHQPSVSVEQTISRPIRVGTYSVALPCARWAMNSLSVGSVDICGPPLLPRIARCRVTFAPRTKIRAPIRAMQMMTVSDMAGLFSWWVLRWFFVVEQPAQDHAGEVGAQQGIGLVHPARAGHVDLDQAAVDDVQSGQGDPVPGQQR